MKISVTQQDIDEATIARQSGGYCCSLECPINRASRRAFPDAANISTGVVIHVNSVAYRLPEEALEFICAFDNHQKVSPIEFEVQ